MSVAPNPQNDAECRRLSLSDLCKVNNLGTLSFFSINARSIVNKFPEFLVQLSATKVKFTFILIVETWLNEINDRGFELEGYDSVSYYRPNRQGGGLKLYYLNNIDVTLSDEHTDGTEIYESILIIAKIPSYGKINVLGLYRMPGKPLNSFIDNISNILNVVCVNRSVSLGDFNVNTLVLDSNSRD